MIESDELLVAIGRLSEGRRDERSCKPGMKAAFTPDRPFTTPGNPEIRA
jgi:hypothetical protein